MKKNRLISDDLPLIPSLEGDQEGKEGKVLKT